MVTDRAYRAGIDAGGAGRAAALRRDAVRPAGGRGVLRGASRTTLARPRPNHPGRLAARWYPHRPVARESPVREGIPRCPRNIRRSTLVLLTALLLLAPVAQASRTLFAGDTTNGQIYSFGIASDGSAALLGGGLVANEPFPMALVGGADGTQLYAALSTGMRRYGIANTGLLTAAPQPVGAGTSPSAAAVSPDGTRLYVTNAGSGNISRYTIGFDGTPAVLTPATTIVGAGPDGIAITPDGLHMYVANGTDGTITVLDGAGTAAQGSPVPAGTGVSGLAVSPDGLHLYAANTGDDSIGAWTINGDGSLTARAGPTASRPATAPAGLRSPPTARGCWRRTRWARPSVGTSWGQAACSLRAVRQRRR